MYEDIKNSKRRTKHLHKTLSSTSTKNIQSIRGKVNEKQEDSAKATLKKNKFSQGIREGSPLINDIHINKSYAQERQLEDLIYLSTSQQPSESTSFEHPIQDQPNLAMPDRQGKEEEDKTTEPGVPWEVSTSTDTGNASVPQPYDVQKDSDQVLQGGTEAIFKVSHSDNNE